MNTSHNSKMSDQGGSRSEAGHRKLARYVAISVAVALAIAIAAVLLRYIDW